MPRPEKLGKRTREKKHTPGRRVSAYKALHLYRREEQQKANTGGDKKTN